MVPLERGPSLYSRRHGPSLLPTTSPPSMSSDSLASEKIPFMSPSILEVHVCLCITHAGPKAFGCLLVWGSSALFILSLRPAYRPPVGCWDLKSLSPSEYPACSCRTIVKALIFFLFWYLGMCSSFIPHMQAAVCQALGPRNQTYTKPSPECPDFEAGSTPLRDCPLPGPELSPPQMLETVPDPDTPAFPPSYFT